MAWMRRALVFLLLAGCAQTAQVLAPVAGQLVPHPRDGRYGAQVELGFAGGGAFQRPASRGVIQFTAGFGWRWSWFALLAECTPSFAPSSGSGDAWFPTVGVARVHLGPAWLQVGGGALFSELETVGGGAAGLGVDVAQFGDTEVALSVRASTWAMDKPLTLVTGGIDFRF
jgi:hypothetical protein